MFLLANFLFAAAKVLDIILTLYVFVLIGRVIISWFNVDPDKPIVRFIYGATEPLLARVRGVLPFSVGGFDFSPIIVWIAIEFVRRFLVQSLYDLVNALR